MYGSNFYESAVLGETYHCLNFTTEAKVLVKNVTLAKFSTIFLKHVTKYSMVCFSKEGTFYAAYNGCLPARIRFQ